MPNFAGSKTQRVNKYAGLRAPQTPQPGLHPGLHCKTTLIFTAWVLSYFFVDFFFRERRRKKEIIFETMTCRVSKMDLYKKGTYAAYAATDTEICTEPIMVDSITFQKWHKDNSCPLLLVRYNTKKDPQAKFFQLFLQQEVTDAFAIECF